MRRRIDLGRRVTRLAAAFAFVLSLLGPPAPVAAKAAQETSSQIPNWLSAKYRGNSMDVRFFHGFAECVTRYWPGGAEALLLTLPDSEAEVTEARRMAEKASICIFSGSVRLVVYRVRGAFAEALLQGQLSSAGLNAPFGLDESRRSFSAKLPPVGEGGLDRGERGAYLTAGWAAYCTVQKDRAAVERLFRTKPSSAQEGKVLVSLNPIFLSCLSTSERLFVTAASMRAFLAQALFWRRVSEGSANAQG